ncbi:hypothetical protein DSCA_09130 [Desulfosarcina alkanivorans]|jgi:hypothetical protein|uniref:Uncharacterized protein n=1 Tax=Desulfosarcina alkanivorans TaxID=571177 RepID=A0A5K7YEA2_9BACT|nr:hypothetical protein [Desulfosarcina alkanivorans]BBO66983.1 hypothetical protein DSCA_09130 [Desulfosarcina alkanivorans]
MDTSLLVAAGASFLAGLLGYIIARLWIKPVARYIATRRKLDRELVRYQAAMATAGGPENRNAPSKKGDTLRKARKHAMDLVSCYGSDIPYWYRLLLDSRSESPDKASGLLANLSRIRDTETVKTRIDSARKAIRRQ